MASPSILGCFAPSSLASSTNRLNHRISDTWLSPSIPGPQWHVRRRGFGLAPLVRKKSAMVTRNIEAHGSAHSLWENLSGQTWSGPRHGATPSHIYLPLPGALHHHRLWALALFTNCVISRLSHLRTRRQCLYVPSYLIRYHQLKFYISNLWSTNNILNQRPVPDSKKFKNHWLCSYSYAYVMFDDGGGEGYAW